MQNNESRQKILMLLLPFWTPLIPPLGMACLKSYLQSDRYEIKTVDANMEDKLYESYHEYFNKLRTYIPEKKQGNFYNTGNNVLKNHLMVYINSDKNDKYIELVKIFVYQHYFVKIDDEQVQELDSIIDRFYKKLKAYILELMEREQPAIVGATVYSGTLAASLFTFKTIKESYPHIKTIMGGGVFADQLSVDSPNFKYFISRVPYIDNILVGEGERLFYELLNNKFKETKKVYTLRDLSEGLLELSTVSIPDFTDFDISKYPQIAAYASRSCPFNCSFCSETVYWGKYRRKDAGKIADELVQLRDKYHCQLFLFGDSLLNPVASELSQEIVDRGLSLYWDGYLRADPHVCNTENTFLWRRGGFYRARLGVESGSQHVLELMGKKITPDQIKAAVRSLASAGIKTTTYWVVGYPGETEEDFQLTLKLIEDLKDDIYEAECNPFDYFINGQVGSDRLSQENNARLLYPEYAGEILIAQTWILDADPSREETYARVCRFVEHCRRIGVPNPYSMKEIYDADERWKRLHKNAVPSIVEFKNSSNIDENKKISNLSFAADFQLDDGDFEF